uniref:FAM193 C-terminal domain-containing protein n=1 Tax=Photinus pyralis TaxID=7054 RepID=A0A1Y1NCD2_PHOPY
MSIMSDIEIDHKQKEISTNLDQFPTMGNLFSKDSELELNNFENGATLEEHGASNSSPTSKPLIADTDYFFKFFDKSVNKDSLQNCTEDTLALESEKIILNAFLNEVRNAKPAPLKNWSALQHYIYYIYRHVISSKPCNSNEIFSNVIIKKIRELVEGLMQEDLTQFCIRLVTLIREYSIVTRGHFDALRYPKVSSYLISLMSYYSAFCSAASKLAPLLPEFDFLIMERFNVNWLCLNKSIFYHYVYKSPAVSAKMPFFHKLKEENKIAHKSLLESYACFSEDMALVESRWANLKLKISNLSQKRAISNPSKHLINDWKMFEEHKKILKTNYWMIRNTQAMQLQDMAELDGHILSLVGDATYIADFLIDSQGNCLCEDCLAAEFRTNILPPPYDEQSPEVYHLISCYICQEPITLESLTNHIIAKHQESPSQKPTRVYLTPHQKRLFCPKKPSRLSDMTKSPDVLAFEGLFENKTALRDSILKIVNSKTSGILSEKSESMYRESVDKKTPPKQTFVPDVEELKHKMPRSLWNSSINPTFDSKDMASKIIEPVFKVASEAPAMKTEMEILMKSASKRNEVRPQTEGVASPAPVTKSPVTDTLKCIVTDLKNKKSEILKNSPDVKQTLVEYAKTAPEAASGNNVHLGPKAATEAAAFRKPHQKSLSNLDTKMLEMFKNANAQKTIPTAAKRTSTGSTCANAACGHHCKEVETEVRKCKQEVEQLIEYKKHSCPDTCDYCDYHKDSRKCDCAFCEVFGSSLPSHAPKTNETRDRLRTRLNQRKEKDKLPTKVVPNGNTKSNIAAVNGSSKLSNTPKTVVNTRNSNEIDSRGPPRVPEVVHVVPPASNKKSALTSLESKKLQALNGRNSLSTQKSVSRAVPEGARNGSDYPPRSSVSSLSTSSLSSDNIGSRDINELLNYIEGNKKIDKAALAQKKADKKARQRLKKAELRERIEKEKEQEEAEAKLKEEERLKAELLAKQLAEKQKKAKKADDQSQEKQGTRKNKKNKNCATKEENEPKHIEETIPAMVTIKRVAEGGDTPATVTITLKGSTPESDKLLFTLVNGYNDKEHIATATINEDNNKNNNKMKNGTIKDPIISNKKDKDVQSKNAKKKKGKELPPTLLPKDVSNGISKELRVTIALDKHKNSGNEPSGKKNSKSEITKAYDPKVANNKKDTATKKTAAQKSANNSKGEISIPMLRLPPGITITKIEGPPTNRNCKNANNTSSTAANQNPNVPVSKSGVIVVDTEKLIQQSITATANKKNKKKNKKKRDGKQPEVPAKHNQNGSEPSMVTLKNPIFHTLQTALCNKVTDTNDLSMYPANQQASIFKNENGMVTIRSPRLQNNFENGSPISNFLTDLKPMFGPEVPSSYIPMCQTNFENKSFNAQEILSGLPGIEITKVDKNSTRNESEHKRSSQPAEVSIIPTNSGANGTDKFNFDKDDWPFESVFTPRDVLEEDMDAEERELEAFKRFCQQSVPPKRKEKVAHLNVKDIVLKKKKDLNYA